MNEGIEHIHNEVVRKRLGQYFTSETLVNMLIDLADIPRGSTGIDPMAGTGNMIMSLIRKGYAKESVYGIEIDKVAGEICSKRAEGANIQIGNAFSKETYISFKESSWNLVIANPPYIRYQSMGNDNVTGMNLPTSKDIRKDLLETIDYFEHLDKEDKRLLKILVHSYSGLSDMTVPCWILCASIVKMDGVLAMVVPDTWLSREYGAIVQYLLLKWFDVQYIIEDADGTWFSNAQVKTNLVVAKRTPRREAVLNITNEDYMLIKTFKDEGDNNVCKLSDRKEKIEHVLEQNLLPKGIGYCIERRQVDYFKNNIYLNGIKQKWLSKVEVINKQNIIKHQIPEKIASGLNIDSIDIMSLEDFGVEVGQGLRTGANRFFYLKMLSADTNTELLTGDKYFLDKPIEIPKEYTMHVLQKQSDLTQKLSIDENSVNGRVIYIQNAAISRDLEKASEATQQKYEALDKTLEQYILRVEQTPFQQGKEAKYVPNLSAVKPNVRTDRCNGEEINRFWYMLPELTQRHIPDFCVPRINHKSPDFYILEERKTVIDANFSTLWLKNGMADEKYAILSLLNSSWSKLCLEYICTVMGGGALKVEATHIKKIPFPKFSTRAYSDLKKYGKILCLLKSCNEQERILDIIDSIILSNILNKCDVNAELMKLKKMLSQKIQERDRYKGEENETEY